MFTASEAEITWGVIDAVELLTLLLLLRSAIACDTFVIGSFIHFVIHVHIHIHVTWCRRLGGP